MKFYSYLFLLLGPAIAPAASAQPSVLAEGLSNLEPRYGRRPKSAALLAADARLIAQADSLFPDRRLAATAYAKRGWDYLRSDDPSTAIKRFNQAWLLDSTNALAFWGFAAVLGLRGQHNASLHHFDHARRLDPGNRRVLVDMAQTLLNRYAAAKNPADLDQAIAGVQAFLSNSPTSMVNFAAYKRLATAYFYQQDYPSAWKYVDLASSLSATEVKTWPFLKKLKKAAPHP